MYWCPVTPSKLVRDWPQKKMRERREVKVPNPRDLQCRFQEVDGCFFKSKKKKKKPHHDRYSSFHILKILKKKLKCIYLKEKKLILQSSPIFNYYTYKINDFFFFAYFKAKFRNFPYYFELSIWQHISKTCRRRWILSILDEP